VSKGSDTQECSKSHAWPERKACRNSQMEIKFYSNLCILKVFGNHCHKASAACNPFYDIKQTGCNKDCIKTQNKQTLSFTYCSCKPRVWHGYQIMVQA
jgi:hypothetical protein